MTTTMHNHKVSPTKTAVITTVLGIGLLSGGYALGDGHIFNTQVTKADNAATTQSKTAQTASADPNTDTAMIESAVNNYLYSKGVTAGSNKIVQLQVHSAWARGKLVNGDSGQAFYAHNVQGNWTVVYAGQTPLTSAIAQQYDFPSQWVGQTSWYN